MGANPLSSGAGEGNRTLVISLEGFCSTIELHPPILFTRSFRRGAHTAPKIGGGGGWIRTNVGARPTDLQSAPFSRSGTPPAEPTIIRKFRCLVKQYAPKISSSVASRSLPLLQGGKSAVAGK